MDNSAVCSDISKLRLLWGVNQRIELTSFKYSRFVVVFLSFHGAFVTVCFTRIRNPDDKS